MLEVDFKRTTMIGTQMVCIFIRFLCLLLNQHPSRSRNFECMGSILAHLGLLYP